MRTIFVILIALMPLTCYCQGFKVKEFKQNINDGSAFHAPLDSLGNPCGLIKVRTDNPDLHFCGSIVGKVENKQNEYWVYLVKGSNQMEVSHPNYLPLHIEFNAFGIDKIDSKSTYVLTLLESKYKKEKCGLTITVKPENAQLFIDDIAIDNLSSNGFYQLYLPKGEYVYRVAHDGYRPVIQTIASGKGSLNLSVELESVMANLQIKCKTETAEILVDGELKGNGYWSGDVLPGPHKIEARQSNFISQIQQISLEEKENRIVSVPELMRSKGKLNISTNLPNMRVMLDGEFVGISPCEVETETGEHYVSCDAYGCLPYRSNVNVNSEDIANVVIKLEFDSNNSFAEYYPKAYQGDIESMSVLAVNRMLKNWHSGAENIEEAVYWRERIEKIDSHYFDDDELDAESWLWTYEDLGDKYAEKGEKEKAIKCYQKCLSLDKMIVEYMDDDADYTNVITKKINALK
jgi:tetratricopeptide (TPR) repeat protein